MDSRDMPNETYFLFFFLSTRPHVLAHAHTRTYPFRRQTWSTDRLAHYVHSHRSRRNREGILAVPQHNIIYTVYATNTAAAPRTGTFQSYYHRYYYLNVFIWKYL